MASKKIKGICISARYDEELSIVKKFIKSKLPRLKIIDFEDVLIDNELLDKCDFIFTIGGDGSVAWLVGAYYAKFGTVEGLKPIVPVVRSKSVGYLRQLDLEEDKFLDGFANLLNGDYAVRNRTVIKTEIDGKGYLAINEINIECAPHLGEFTVYIEDGKISNYHTLTSTMADGLMIVTPIGSTGWALSYEGLINLNENSLELIFMGGIHSSANFIIPRKAIKINLNLKNPSFNETTISAYNKKRKELKMPVDRNPVKTLEILYGSRIIIDGKVVAFGINDLEIDSKFSIPFVFLHQETDVEKARKLTELRTVK